MDDQQFLDVATEVAMTAQSNVGSRDATQEKDDQNNQAAEAWEESK